MQGSLGIVALTWAIATSAAAQPAVTSPDVSEITFTTGTASVTATGAFDAQAEVTLSAEDTMSSRGITWFVFGEPEAPVRATVVYGPDGAGLVVERGAEMADASYGSCTGETKLMDGLVSGRYTCEDAPAYDLSAVSDLGVATITIEFTAR